MVSALARVGPGVTIPSGRKVLSGANVATDAQVPSKTVAVTAADRVFMDGVIAVNREFSIAYHELAASDINRVHGISVNPVTAFNPVSTAPTIGGSPTLDPAYRNRIIGDVRIGNTFADLDQRVGSDVSLRADEGTPFVIGSIASMAGRTTFHALEGTDVMAGIDGRYGYHSVVNGGGAAGETVAGNGVTLGDWAVLFRSRVGDGSSIGFRSLVQQVVLPPNTIVPTCTVMIGTAAPTKVEWCNATP